MQTFAFSPAIAFSGYHTVMADSRFFAPRETNAASQAADNATTTAAASAALIERDRILSALVARMAVKDEAALAELFDMTAKRLHSFSLRIVRDVGLAEEVTEDTLFQAWREATRFDAARGKVITWLLTICRSRALDALRRADIADCVEDPDDLRPDVVQQHGGRKKIVHRNIEEPLDLSGMEVHGQHPVRAGGGNKISNEL